MRKHKNATYFESSQGKPELNMFGIYTQEEEINRALVEREARGEARGEARAIKRGEIKALLSIIRTMRQEGAKSS